MKGIFYYKMKMGDYIIFMDKGRVIEAGAKNRVMLNPQHSLVKKLLN